MAEGALTRKLSAWLRVGAVDSRANPIAGYLGGGAVATIGGWRLGLAAAHARLGSSGRETLFAPQRARRAETVIEITAQRPLASWLLVQPDVQYVINPGWGPFARTTLVAGLRISLALPDS
jgi:porin